VGLGLPSGLPEGEPESAGEPSGPPLTGGLSVPGLAGLPAGPPEDALAPGVIAAALGPPLVTEAYTTEKSAITRLIRIAAIHTACDPAFLFLRPIRFTP